MSERYFRIVIGVWLIAGLFLGAVEFIYILSALLLVEGVTNYRVPALISRLRYGKTWQDTKDDLVSSTSRLSFEAERALRFIVAVFIIVPLQPGMDVLWWLTWFVGFALIGGGLEWHMSHGVDA